MNRIVYTISVFAGLMLAMPMMAGGVIVPPVSSQAQTSPRAIDICQNWRFMREPVPPVAAPVESVPAPALAAFDDAAWETVSLPHTVRIDSPKVGGKYFLGGCWYRHAIQVDPAWAGRRVSLEFDGAMQKADIWVNGTKAGTHLGGYLPFVVDLMPYLVGHNQITVALRLDNDPSPDFPPGGKHIDFTYQGGLYRQVRLVVTDPVHITDAIETNRIAGGGVFVHCQSADAKAAVVIAQTDVRNDDLEPVSILVEHTLLAPDGVEVARDSVSPESLGAGAEEEFASTISVTNPKLWHPDHPWLYTLVSTVKKNGAICDQMRTRCGIRWLRVSDDGFFLNGEKLVFRGANRHMSFPWLGNAASDNMQYRDIRLLKEGGFNFVRLCHYPQSPATMDACDELGVVALVCTPGWQFFADTEAFKTAAKQNIREMVRWHRNHPSAVLWETSLNETYGHDAFYEECSNIAKAEYPGGQLLTGGDTYASKRTGFYDIPYTVWKGSYNRAQPPDAQFKKSLHREYGDNDLSGSVHVVERGSGEAVLMRQAWNFQWTHNKNLSWPWTIGDAIWEGIDTHSAAGPSLCGPLDLYRIPKFSYYFYQSQRDPAVKLNNCDSGPMVQIVGYWTDRPSPARVVVYSNGEQVELFLNGRSIEKQKPDAGPDTNYGKNLFDGGNCRNLDHPPFTFASVPYEPGELKAVAYMGGQIAASSILRTPGKPVALHLRAATLGKPLVADGADSVFVYAEVVDAAGVVVPDNSQPLPNITFQVQGAGRLVMPPQIVAEAGIAPMILQSTTTPGTITINATAAGLAPAALEIQAVPSK